MSDGCKTLQWMNPRHGVSWSQSPARFFKRFSITETTSGWIVVDHTTKEMAHCTTRTAARAWAGIRIGERSVRHT